MANLGVAGAIGAVTEQLEFNCLASAAVDDLVRLNLSLDKFVDVATSNLDQRPVIGRIRLKLTPTTVIVILSGVVAVGALPPHVITGLTKGKVWLGVVGEFTLTPPDDDYLQVLGYYYGSSSLRLDPEALVTRQTL